MSHRSPALVLVLGLLGALPVLGVPPAASAPPSAPSKEKTAKILELMKLTHADRVGDSMMESFRNIMPAAQFERLAKTGKADQLVGRLLPVYDKHFSEQDLDGLIAFYKTPLGQKVIVEMPAVAQESSTVGMRFAQELLAESAREQKSDGAAPAHP